MNQDEKLSKNVILEGPFSVETPDTSGEVLMINGADISDLQSGKAFLNTEHIMPSDEKSDIPEDFRGFNSIIGRVVNAKKIFSDKDCSSDREKKAWNYFRKPMIYGQVEIFDDEGHPNAKAAAALARIFNKTQDGPKLGLSVEGATVKREGNILKNTVIRGMACTLKPANKSAIVDIVKDTNPVQVSKSINNKTADGFESLRKSIDMQYFNSFSFEISNDFGLSKALENLKKTLTAGGMNAAPGALTQDSALQTEHQSSHLAKLTKLVGKKKINKNLIKSLLPGISDEDAARVELALKKKRHEQNEELTKSLYDDMLNVKSTKN